MKKHPLLARSALLLLPLLLLSQLAPAAATAATLSVAVVDKEGKPVPDAIVVVLPANTFDQPKTRLPTTGTIVQEKMQFVPQVSLYGVGAKVKFANEDPWDHHVRSSPAGMGQFNASNAGFEIRLEGKTEGKPAPTNEVNLNQPGVLSATLLGCFLHGSMRGYVYVSESPWAIKTGADGMANFDGLPQGNAQIKLWQADQLVNVPMQAVVIGVAGAAPAKASFQLTVVPRRKRV